MNYIINQKIQPEIYLALPGNEMMRELEIVELLNSGIDPVTKRPIQIEHNPRLDKLRSQYLEELRRCASQSEPPVGQVVKGVVRHDGKQSKTGTPWSVADNNRLKALWTVETDVTSSDVAKRLDRTPVAVLVRLVHMGLYASMEEAAAEDTLRRIKKGSNTFWLDVPSFPGSQATAGRESPHRASAGKVWDSASDRLLKSLWAAPGRPSLDVVAIALGRSSKAILLRLIKVGIFDNEEQALEEDAERTRRIIPIAHQK